MQIFNKKTVSNKRAKKTGLQNLILKSLYVVAALKYPKLKKDLRYFVRDNYYSNLFQIKFLYKDYFLKKQYKIIDFQGEFEHELRYVLPFTYWHYLNGTLNKTISCKYTKELYFFSSNHEEKYDERTWTDGYDNYTYPNMTHTFSFDYTKWVAVPFKHYYKNNTFVFEKPILIIANKYNIEWDHPPINFFDIPTLDKIIRTYQEKYQIIYNRPLNSHIVSDNSEILDLGEYAWIQENHPNVLLMNDLYSKYKSSIVNNFNHLQLMVYANCNHFISAHGGTAAFASYFKGTNIIFSNPEWGMEYPFNEYSTILSALSGAKILHAKNTGEIHKYLQLYY